MTPKNTTVAAALVGGYLLGRTRKARLAMGVGLFLAGRKLDLDPRRIGRLIAASPATGALSEQVRRDVVEATKTAAAQALGKRTAHLAESLQKRTKALAGPSDGDGDGADGEAEASSEGGKSTSRSSGRGRSSASGGTRSSQTSRKRTSAPRKSSGSRTRKGGNDDDG
ncbi:hypothetical protein [Streptomyces sp. c-19]|uniref:hypothetical protein n=1 Tax=Streptomyces sp. c-19 TaxID=2789275 RepID=UPI00397F480F